jgi:hypothetical protein
MSGWNAINPIVLRLLTSPLHWLVSWRFIALSVTGRRSGTRYTFPIEYFRRDGALFAVTERRRLWWRNVARGAPVEVAYRGRRRAGYAIAITDEEAVAAFLLDLVQRRMLYRLAFRVRLDASGQPRDPDGFTRETEKWLLVRITARRR